MGSIYKRGDSYYIKFRDRSGTWRARSAGSTKKDAEQVLRDVERAVRLEGPAPAPRPAGPAALREYTSEWVSRRKRIGLRNAKNDDGHLKFHILPALGDMPVDQIRVRHVREFVGALREKGLAHRTVRKIYATLHKLFADLIADEIVTTTPCVLTQDHLPKNRDKNPEWRSRAVFTRDEAELLISSDAIPTDRRVLYGLLFLTGVRIGEAAGLHWRDLDERASPLKRLTVAHSYDHATKTEMPREVPIHPVLAGVLAEWKLRGWAEMAGHHPRPDDLIIPSREGQMRSRNQTRNKFLDDLKRLGLRHRRVHDTRRTFITLTRVDGARRDVLEQITHAPRGNILDQYTTLPWPTLCEAVACLKVERIKSNVYALPKAASGEGGEVEVQTSDGNEFVTGLVTARRERAAFVAKSWQRHAKSRQRNGGGAGNRKA